MVFKLWVDRDLPERARKYIPGNLLRLSGQCFVRVLGVKNKNATLGLFQTRADAEADERCVELVAPPVTAYTLSHLGVKYVDGEGWKEAIYDSVSEDESEGEGAQESPEELPEEEGEWATRQSSEGGAEMRAAVNAERVGEQNLLGGSLLQTEERMKEVAEATRICDFAALERLASLGLAGREDLQLLKEQGPEFAQALAVAADLSLFDAQRLIVYARSGGGETDGRGQSSSEDGRGRGGSGDVAIEGLGHAAGVAAPAARRSSLRPQRRAAVEARKSVSFLEALNSVGADASASSEEEQTLSTESRARGHTRRGGVGDSGCSSEPLRSRMSAAQLGMATPNAAARPKAGAARRAVSCSSELAAPMGRSSLGGAGMGVVSGGATGGVAAQSTAGAGDVACLMGGVPKADWESVSRECLEWLAPAVLQRAPREVEMRRPVKQLELWLRAAVAKGATVAVLPPGDESAVLDAVQEVCAQLELREVRQPQGEAPQHHQQEWGDGGAVYPTMVLSTGTGTASAERLDEERAMMEAVMFVAKDGGAGERVGEVAAREPGDASIMGAASALGGVEKLRPILYMGAGSIQMPAGMLATPSSMLLISNAKRLRALVVGQLAEQLRGLLPSAGTKAETASNLAEAVWTGTLVSKVKLQEIFQPKGGSLLLAGGTKKVAEQSPTELFSRGLNLLSVAYQSAHGSFDATVAETFGRLFSAFLDATQKRIEPARAAAFVVEPVLHEMERQWRRSTSGLQSKRPIIGEVAASLRPQMLQNLSVEVAAAAATGGEATAGKGKGGGEKGARREEGSVEALQKKIDSLERRLSKAGGDKSPKEAGEGPKFTRKSWRAKVEAWEADNPGKCWYVENQHGGCTQGRKCRNWYEGHPEPKQA